uniref:Uncharacterized protein n=1 Tax=Arundo donax TaxID=35708 RepID=A0A0A8Z313_ARUDO
MSFSLHSIVCFRVLNGRICVACRHGNITWAFISHVHGLVVRTEQT